MLFNTAYKKTISTMTIICFIGIFIGTFSLTIVTAIMRGFEITIHKKIQGIHAHIIIDAYKKPIKFKALSQVLNNEFPEIAALSPHAERNALIRPCNNTTDNHHELPTVVMIKGIDPTAEMLTSSLFSKIVLPKRVHNLEELLSNNTIVIGKQYATSNQLNVGDAIELLF